MDSRHLMERAENALRTGQTENLFPLYYRRTVEQIAAEKAENRRRWAATGPAGATAVQTLYAREAMEAITAAVKSAWGNILEAFGPIVKLFADIAEAQTDYQLMPPPARETVKERERRLRNEQAQARAAFKTAHAVQQRIAPHRPINIRRNP